MLDSLLQVRYNDKRKILVDFSGFGHLFATQLSWDSCVAFYCPYLGSVSRMADYICMENNFLSLIKTRHSTGLASGRLHWVIRPRKPVSPQHANKTILFGFNVPLSGAIFVHRTICGEEGKYADQ